MKSLASRIALVLSLGSLVSCSAAGGDVGRSGSSGSSGSGQGGSAGSAGGSGSAGSAGSISSEPALAQNLVVTDVAVFQAVRIPIVVGGQPATQFNAPILAGRDAIFRIYVALTPDWTPREVTAELITTAPDGSTALFTDKRTILVNSADGDASSVLDVQVPGANLPIGTTWSVRLVTADGVPTPATTPSPAKYPVDGSNAGIDLRDDKGGIQLVLVPIRYNYDSSGRLPDLSDAQIDRYRQLLLSVYPLANINISIRDVFDWNKGPDFTGDFDFSALNDALWDLRASDNAAPGAYYYGLVNPATSFNAYCSSSCTTGQSYVVDNNSTGEDRVGAGIGFTGDDSAWTLIHELGHEHGREHAPCDVSPSDPGYPYDGGDIGVWAHDPRNNAFYSPTSMTDFMGYCQNTWVSDYTYTAIFRRVVEVNGLVPFANHVDSLRPHRVVRVYPDGSSRWGSSVRVSSNARGALVDAHVLAGDHSELSLEPVHVRREAHGGAFVLLVPELPSGARTLRTTLPDGRNVTLSLP